MLYKTKGIVLNFVKFRESSIVVKIFTEQFGLKSYIINSIRTDKPRSSIALYQPLTLLDLVVYNSHKQEINRISESKLWQPYHSINQDIRKIAIASFINEILLKTLKEDESGASTELFYFVSEKLQDFDKLKADFQDFHLYFLAQLPEYLGFGIDNSEVLLEQINVVNPIFNETISNLFHTNSYSPLNINGDTRSIIAELFIRFYRIHLEDFGEVKSLEILSSVFK